jgi:hypothetical protein
VIVQILIHTIGHVVVGELLVEHTAERLSDVAILGGVLCPIGHRGPVELLLHLLVRPCRRWHEGQREHEHGANVKAKIPKKDQIIHSYLLQH